MTTQLGSQGDLVRAWQSFPAGQKLDPGGLDGRFAENTFAATQEFQRRTGLRIDSIAGRETLLKAAQLRFELIGESAADASGSIFPPRPDFPPLENTRARQAVFGKFDYFSQPESGNREHIQILGTWQKRQHRHGSPSAIAARARPKRAGGHVVSSPCSRAAQNYVG